MLLLLTQLSSSHGETLFEPVLEQGSTSPVSWFVLKLEGLGRGTINLLSYQGSGYARTRSAVEMVKVAYAVLVRSIAWLAVETRLAGTFPTRVLDDHSLTKILVDLQGSVSLFHEFRGSWKIIPSSFARFLSWKVRLEKVVNREGRRALLQALFVFLHPLFFLLVLLPCAFRILFLVPCFPEVRVGCLAAVRAALVSHDGREVRVCLAGEWKRNRCKHFKRHVHSGVAKL